MLEPEDGFTPDQVRGAEKIAAAGVEAQREQQYIDALLVEREGYARFGRADRIADVDAELERRGHRAAAADRAEAAPKTPRGRRATPTQEA